jgi:beta-hydroxylase
MPLLPLKALPRRFLNRLTMLLFLVLLPLERVLFRFSEVGHTEIVDPARFDWVPDLERNWRLIRQELDQVLRYRNDLPNYLDLSDEAAGLTERDNWKSFFFYAYGVKVACNCARCPETAALLQRIGGMKSGFFSILMPGARLKPHRGHYAGVLRYHLALLVADPARCGLRVGSRVLHWEEGRSVIFDDTFEHEAWNESDQPRVVLFVDFARPLPFPLSALNHAMIWLVGHSSVVLPGMARLAAWNRRFATIWRAGT